MDYRSNPKRVHQWQQMPKRSTRNPNRSPQQHKVSTLPCFTVQHNDEEGQGGWAGACDVWLRSKECQKIELQWDRDRRKWDQKTKCISISLKIFVKSRQLNDILLMEFHSHCCVWVVAQTFESYVIPTHSPNHPLHIYVVWSAFNNIFLPFQGHQTNI